MRLGALALALGLAGCANLDDSIRAAASDNAVVCATYIGPWGTVMLSRSNLAHGRLRCRSDGHDVTDSKEGATR